MLKHSKVVWSEGMFLRTQHFQQQDRYLENLIREAIVQAIGFHWGVSRLSIDLKKLEQGKLVVTECAGVMRDGTPFDCPKDQAPPQILDISETVRETVVHLAIPVDQAGQPVAEVSGSEAGPGRYLAREMPVYDCSDRRTGAEAAIRVADLRLRLLLDTDDHAGFHCVPLVRINEVSANKKISLDNRFIPTCLDFHASDRLSGLVSELEGLLRQRSDVLAAAVSGPGEASEGSIGDFLMLQALNRNFPVIAHLAGDPPIHPETLFRLLVGLTGELATFYDETRRPPVFPRYRHENLTDTFDALEATLRRYLATALVPPAVRIPLEEFPEYSIFTGTAPDRSLLETAVFILVARAQMDPAVLGEAFPDTSTVGSTEKIAEIVKLRVGGIPLRLRPTAPPQIRYDVSATYFELDRTSKAWQDFQQTSNLTIHVGGDFPGLKLELWAIRPRTTSHHVGS